MTNSLKTCKNLCTAIISFVLLFAVASCERSREPQTPFKTIAINDIEIKSVYITDKDFSCPFNVILPSDYKTSGKKYPVLYLLHGMNNDNYAWQRSGNVVELTEKAVNDGVIAPFIIVLPNAYMTFYVDDLDFSGIPVFEIYPKLKFESFFTKELQPYIEKNFPIMTDREHTAIAGLSMGGYGASYHAFNYPEKYSYCASFSGAVSGGDWTGLTDRLPSVEDIFEKNGYDSDSFPLLPEYVMDCGEDDLICGEFNRVTEEYFKSIKFPHVYRTFPGGHDWDYWSPAYVRMLPELAKHFGK